MRIVAKRLGALAGLALILGAEVSPGAPRPVPPEVLTGAAAATRVLGAEVLKGNYSYSIQRMYPRYQKRVAMRAGGMEKLIERLAAVPGEMRKKGISMLKFEVGQPTAGHQVYRGRGVNKETGEAVELFLEWLVFVPTRTEFKVIDKGVAKRVETHGYQVAIAKKGGSEWRFIDGSTLTIPELRSFFPSLPDDAVKLGLPPVGGKELK